MTWRVVLEFMARTRTSLFFTTQSLDEKPGQGLGLVTQIRYEFCCCLLGCHSTVCGSARTLGLTRHGVVVKHTAMFVQCYFHVAGGYGGCRIVLRES